MSDRVKLGEEERAEYRLYDAHNHLQDGRLQARRGEILKAAARERIAGMVVNGSCEEDWEAVRALAREYPVVLPSFGYHPWYVRERTESWLDRLREYLDSVPCAVGEIGLDRWIKDADLPRQEEMFVAQLELAAERNLPASIHCLRAWGRVYDLLRGGPRPACGFLLHSYGGPAELVKPLAALGGYFSFPGDYLRDRRDRQRETFRQVPADRLLLETDAPDQPLPAELERYSMANAEDGRVVNHPANLVVVYAKVAEWLGEPMDRLAARIEENFWRLFGACRPVSGGQGHSSFTR